MRLHFMIWAAAFFCAVPAWADESSQESEEYPAYRPGQGFSADREVYSLAVLDFLEVAPLSDRVPGEFEGFWRLGNAYDSFWLKAEGEGLVGDPGGEAELQALYSRILTPFFDVQAGVRLDTEFGDRFRARPQLVVGLEGLAPFLFEVEPAIFVSPRGEVSARIEGYYDVLITQRLVLQPEAELNVAVQQVEAWGVGRGLNDIGVGARLRYEFLREVAPYVGVNWTRHFGETAEFARAEGRPATETRFVAGARLWW